MNPGLKGEVSLSSKLSAQNPKSIQEMFASLSKKYDTANSVLSFGTHHRWKKKLVQASQVQPGAHVLDCATGTGDLAFLFEAQLQGTGKVVGCDFCEPMLDEARKKARSRNSRVHFEFSDVTRLPHPDAEFDVASISFGIRNVTDTFAALKELGRVVKPGGKVLVLEFGQPPSRSMGALYHLYSAQVLPRIGGWLSGQRQAYQYLQTSSAAFPCGQDFLEIAASTKVYAKVEFHPLQFGIVYLYTLQTHEFSTKLV